MTHSSSFAYYTKELSSTRYEPLKANTERECLFQYASGSAEAFDRLVSAHLRFVVYFLRNYKIPSEIDLMDIIQEANLGLMEGIRRFNPNKYRCRVFTYCSYWIRFYITRSLIAHQKLVGIFSPLEEDAEFPEEMDIFPYYEQIATDIVEHGLSSLTEREKAILTHFFGLVPPFHPKTLQEIGSMLHMNIERVRQVKEAALEKLKKQQLNDLM